MKIHILSGRLAVAFAGDPGLACYLITELKTEAEATQNLDVPQCLFEKYRQRATEIPETTRSDFLILRLLDDGPRLDKVTLEDGIRNAERAYIGDAEGYRQLTGLLGTYAGPKIRMVQQPDGSFITGLAIRANGRRAMVRSRDGRFGGAVS